MDQAQFRQLISTPRAAGSSNAAATRKFGQVLKRGAPPKEEFKKPDFKPRSKVLKGGKKPTDSTSESDGAGGSEYRDRAAERREGVDSDFAGVEKLLEDFKARSESSEDRQAVEDQMKYLGGDAEHSVLVKGLDMALLARIKSQQTTEQESTLEEVEAELDSALRSAVVEKKKKRTRDEMVADLKARVSGGGTKEVGVEDAPMKGFKPIGKQSKSKGKGKEVLPGGLVEGEKKRRKKVKQVEEVLPPPPAATLVVPVAASAPIQVDDDKDEFDDIFGDAGEYKGLDTDSDSDTDKPSVPATSTAASSSALPTMKAKYFSDDSDDEGPITTAPSSVTQLARTAAAAAPEEEEGEEGVGIGMRLQGLSGSSDVRTMLDMDKEAEKKEMKALRKGKGVEGGPKKKEKVRTEEEQSNHEYQVMMNHLEKKEKHKEGGPKE